MGLAGGQLITDLHDENGLMLFGKGIFALVWGERGIQILQFLCRDKGDLALQALLDAECPLYRQSGVADSVDDFLDDLL